MHLNWMLFCRQSLLIYQCCLLISLTGVLCWVILFVDFKSFSFLTVRYTASAQNSQCESMEEKRACLSASRSTRLKRMRAKSTQNTSTLPPARSKSSRWEQWQEHWFTAAQTFMTTIQIPPPMTCYSLKEQTGSRRQTGRRWRRGRHKKRKSTSPPMKPQSWQRLAQLLACHWSQPAAANDQLKDIYKCKSCVVLPTVQTTDAYAALILKSKRNNTFRLSFWLSQNSETTGRNVPQCNQVFCCSAAPGLRSHTSTTPHLPASTTHTTASRWQKGITINDDIIFFFCIFPLFWLCVSPFFRNGSPNHQPEPVVQVADVSSNVFTPLCILINTSRGDKPLPLSRSSAEALCEHENKQK